MSVEFRFESAIGTARALLCGAEFGVVPEQGREMVNTQP